jgi:hypothetical protein
VHEFLLGLQLLFRFTVCGVVYAAIYRAYSGALWFIVKTHAFGAFVGYNVIDIHAHRSLIGIGIDFCGLIQGSENST